ncbi:MAG TPA: Wzz/FepE/Etk N-terminal domain-containing protein [Burkholderiaceae bacterium]|nr:Wzz/FepE/Etk N-terminal domain-containing protein [Burkholderiaceae bacterium]
MTPLELGFVLVAHWKLLLFGTLAAAILAAGSSFLIKPTFTSRTVFLPPQHQQSAAASALAQLGSLSGLAGAAAGIKSPGDQYIALLESATVADRLIDEFKLMSVYEAEYRFEARRRLAENVRVSLGKKDGLITIEVDDHDPRRAADIANRHVEELRRLTSQLSLTEAQQRRAFFEAQLKNTRDQLTKAQQALQASGFNQAALRADARVAAEGYARLRAEATAAEVRLQALRRNLADTAPEVQQALSVASSLRSQVARLEEASDTNGGPDYVSKFREFKYQETLFELFARNFELARLDESREGALIQVVDEAKPAEWKSRPKRALIATTAAILALFLLVAFVIGRHAWRSVWRQPDTAAKIAQLRASLRRH